MGNIYEKNWKIFMRQTSRDVYNDYTKILEKSTKDVWNYVILTASNKEQAAIYRKQLEWRVKNHYLPLSIHFAVIEDREEQRIGSGGATLQALRYVYNHEGWKMGNPYVGLRILVIHSGGDSKRVPQYSVTGKIFTPIPRELPDGRLSTLFDEIFIYMSSIALKVSEGMFVISGDVLLLFNPQQIDYHFYGAAAVSVKADVKMGINHGVFLRNKEGVVESFLHKKSEDALRLSNAVDEYGFVEIDTGMVVFDSQLSNTLFSCVCADGNIDEKKYECFVSEDVNLNFYEDFLYPLAIKSTLSEYLKKPSEGKDEIQVRECREKLWNVFRAFSLKLFSPSPAEFIHWGTNSELLEFRCKKIERYSALGWKKKIGSIEPKYNSSFSTYNSFLDSRVEVENDSYIENSWINGLVSIGKECILSNMALSGGAIPERTVFHGVPLKTGEYVVRVYHVYDNIKGILEDGTKFLGKTLFVFLKQNMLQINDIWETEVHSLWDANLYSVENTMEEATEKALLLLKIVNGNATSKEFKYWKESRRVSLASGIIYADAEKIYYWERKLRERIMAKRFVKILQEKKGFEEASKILGEQKGKETFMREILHEACCAENLLKSNIFYAASHLAGADTRRYLKKKCFNVIQQMIIQSLDDHNLDWEKDSVKKKETTVCLPLRVNWGGGWSDTPPYCMEHGGAVLNAAIKMEGNFPVQVVVRKIPQMEIQLFCKDTNNFVILKDVQEIINCSDVNDPFSLHKACLLASGLIQTRKQDNLADILKHWGGGFNISTQAIGVPRGSGLGTSSILAAACVKGIFELFGRNVSEHIICQKVLCVEQLMETGGGWQDQLGGLIPGIKFITSEKGTVQMPNIASVKVSARTRRELQERFALIYTGQRRVAKNILREVMGYYIDGDKEAINSFEEIQKIAACMRVELEKGEVTKFAYLMSQHWEISQKLDPGITNTCIEQIFLECDDLIDGKLIAGAGGGGFLQVILKLGVSKRMLNERIEQVFQNSGVKVWDSELWFGLDDLHMKKYVIDGAEYTV